MESPPHIAPDVAVIGAGPAGLMAAGAAARSGARVVILDHMPSPARKFLMAGKSGLNITRVEDPACFRAAYSDAAPRLAPMLDAFGPAEVTAWMEGLGQPAFTGSTGRVFPVAMKASPLLRAWLARLDAAGVALHRRWRFLGWEDGLDFATPDGPARLSPRATVLALGGASWRRLGSDGAWAGLPGLAAHAAPFAPSNAGLRVAWSAHMAPHLGQPLKAMRLTAGGIASRGEIVLSARGIEGGGLYPLTPALRGGAPLWLDLKPDLTEGEIAARLARRGKASLSSHLRRALRLTPAQVALLHEMARPLPAGPATLAALIKALPVSHDGPRPLDEAISTAGGLRWDALDGDLMLRDRPGTFACGEMLDWEAPTGGYLLTACLATGAWAGAAAARYAATA